MLHWGVREAVVRTIEAGDATNGSAGTRIDKPCLGVVISSKTQGFGADPGPSEAKRRLGMRTGRTLSRQL